jgi:hypothetical protein
MRPYQERTNSPQAVASLLLSRAAMGPACGSTSTKRNTTAPRMRSFDGHFTCVRHQVKIIADRDHTEGITSGLGSTKFGFTPGKMQGATNGQIAKLRRPEL